MFLRPLPVLVARMPMAPMTTGTHGAEPRSLLVQSLLQHDFQLVTPTVLDAPPVTGWAAVVQPSGRALHLVVLTPAGERFYDGTVVPPAGWVRSMLAGRQVLLLAGGIPAPTATSRTSCSGT